MTPEDFVRNRVYDPYYNDPDPPSLVINYGKTERRLAFLFIILAVFAIGLGIGIALP